MSNDDGLLRSCRCLDREFLHRWTGYGESSTTMGRVQSQ